MCVCVCVCVDPRRQVMFTQNLKSTQHHHSVAYLSLFQRLYAKAGYYYITVEASDKGAERRVTTQRFVIDVYDVNDAFPVFVQPDPDNAVVQILEVPCTQSDIKMMMMMMMMMIATMMRMLLF